MLERVSRVVVRRHLAVIVAALLIAVAAVIFGGGVEKDLSHGGFDDPAAESTAAERILVRDFRGGEPNLVLIAGADRSVDAPDIAAAGRRLTELAAAQPGVLAAESYWTSGQPETLRSGSSRAALVLIRVAGDEGKAADRAETLVPALVQQAGPLRIQAAGPAQVEAEVGPRTEADLQKAELIAAPITLLLLLLVFGSAVAAALPLVIAGLSVVTTLAVLRVIASVTPVSVYSMNIITALGLGLAIDYSLFIVTRFREELATRGDVPEAVRVTVHTAGRTVLFSGVTVALSLAALLVFPLFFLRSFAYGGVAVVLLAVVEAVVVLPAILRVLGPRVDSLNVVAALSRRRTPGARPSSPEGGFWHRLALTVMRRPVPFAVVVVSVLLLLGSPFRHIQFGLFDDRVLPRDAQVHQATQVLRTEFDTSGARAIPVVMTDVPAWSAASRVPDYAQRLSALPGVERVDALTGSYAGGRLVEPPDRFSGRFGAERDSWLSVVSRVEPLSSGGSAQVRAIRAVPSPGPALVGGQAAQLVDTKAAIRTKSPLAVAIVVVAMLLLLFLFTGSVLIPVKAIVLNALSLTATFGAMVWIFQEGHLLYLVGDPIVTGSLDITIPILMFCVAFGLSMDYEVFLISRIREEYLRTGDNTRAVAVGLERTGRLITAAAVLIAVVLLAFATSGVTLLKLLGVGLALAVIVDATLVRGVLVPAFMRIAGQANWWAPRPLRRLHRRIGLAEGEYAAGGPVDGPARQPGQAQPGKAPLGRT